MTYTIKIIDSYFVPQKTYKNVTPELIPTILSELKKPQRATIHPNQ